LFDQSSGTIGAAAGARRVGYRTYPSTSLTLRHIRETRTLLRVFLWIKYIHQKRPRCKARLFSFIWLKAFVISSCLVIVSRFLLKRMIALSCLVHIKLIKTLQHV